MHFLTIGIRQTWRDTTDSLLYMEASARRSVLGPCGPRIFAIRVGVELAAWSCCHAALRVKSGIGRQRPQVTPLPVITSWPSRTSFCEVTDGYAPSQNLKPVSYHPGRSVEEG
jgi:hypothetical protein